MKRMSDEQRKAMFANMNRGRVSLRGKGKFLKGGLNPKYSSKLKAASLRENRKFNAVAVGFPTVESRNKYVHDASEKGKKAVELVSITYRPYRTNKIKENRLYKTKDERDMSPRFSVSGDAVSKANVAALDRASAEYRARHGPVPVKTNPEFQRKVDEVIKGKKVSLRPLLKKIGKGQWEAQKGNFDFVVEKLDKDCSSSYAVTSFRSGVKDLDKAFIRSDPAESLKDVALYIAEFDGS